MGARWAFHEDVVRLAAALRPALAVRGVPGHVYVDYADLAVIPTGSATALVARVPGPLLTA
jgi:putative transposase